MAERRYSDKEIAAIFRTAAEAQTSAQPQDQRAAQWGPKVSLRELLKCRPVALAEQLQVLELALAEPAPQQQLASSLPHALRHLSRLFPFPLAPRQRPQLRPILENVFELFRRQKDQSNSNASSFR